MSATPEDLVEAWHLVVADGADPKSWRMSESLWQAVCRCAEQRDCIDAGDPLPIEGDRSLLGTPVEIDDAAPLPTLSIVRGGQSETVTIAGNPQAERYA